MIEEIRIENLGVIESAAVELGPGLTVVTGETGAGKTMVLTGVGLLLGAKADAASVRSGAPSAVVEGRIVIAPDGPVAQRVADSGGALDDDAVLIARSVAADSGRSRAYLGGRSVPQSALADIAADLVTVHGQSDQIRLRSAAHQRAALDEFGGEDVSTRLDRYRGLYERRQRCAATLDEMTARASERAVEAERLAFGLREIEALDPKSDEDTELADEAHRLTFVEDLRTAATTAQALLSGVDGDSDSLGAIALTEHARRSLEHVADHDSALGGLAGRIAELGYAITDIAAELGGYVAGLDADPGRLEVVQDRRAALTGLGRKYGPSVNEVIAWAESSRTRLAELLGDTDRSAELTLELTVIDEELETAARELSAARSAAATRLGEAVTGELAGLAMTGAQLTALVRTTGFGPWGRDEIDFALTPHAGAPARSLSKGASGGELSRVMLALEVVLAQSGAANSTVDLTERTFIFDEVDSGVGGRTATEIGFRLADLATSAQVVVVTHLAQVAAFADRHVVVEKASADADATVTAVRLVDGQDRLTELARMLSGQDSSTALQHAAELRDAARSRLIFAVDS